MGTLGTCDGGAVKIEDRGVTAEFIEGYYPDPDTVRFGKDGVTVDVPLHILQLAWHAWA